MGVPWINRVNTRILPCEFEYYEPTSIHEAIKLLGKLGPDAKILAGGTDLLVQIKMKQINPKYIINIKKIKELYGLKDYGEHLSIGALTRLKELEENNIIKEKFTALHEAVKSMASPQIRNMATIGGNLCNASPAADTAPPLMVFNAKLRIAGPYGVKDVPITEFFRGPKKTILNYDEILTEIIIPYPTGHVGSAFIKIARTSMDLAKVNAAAKLVVDKDGVVRDVAVALGSVAPTPVRAKSVEEYLRGRVFTKETAWNAAKLVVNDISPITDIRSTAEYRRSVAKTIVYDVLLKAFERAKR
ncbi:xanthine dehydrogenase family protein subunit M [Desulfurococcaceae archaeon MEX13E-LK6-19]|nr:xanthine dehydrogenase family protein subunit M [Desulfurococcaceae archaeon MEX13E-LK6-19]